MNEDTKMSEQDQKDILSMDEATTYFLINECGAFLFRMNHDLADDRIPKESVEAVKTDMINIREIQLFTVENLQRFGVDPKSVDDKTEGDYWKWYTFWNKWEEEWKVVSTGEYKDYLPKAKWNDQEPSQEEQPEE